PPRRAAMIIPGVVKLSPPPPPARHCGQEALLPVDAPAPAFSINCDPLDGSIVHMPSPRVALRRAVPTVVEGLIAPVGIFYLTLIAAGLRPALIAALLWSYFALV